MSRLLLPDGKGRMLAAALFVVVACLPYYASALGWDGEVGVPVGIAYLALRLRRGAGWVVLLLLVPPLLLYPLGQDPDDSDQGRGPRSVHRTRAPR